MFAPTVGGGISTMPPAAAERTHTAPTDGAMTFDSPFPAVLLAVWGNLPIARPWSGAGAFLYTNFCVRAGMLSGFGLCAGFRA